MKTTTNYNEDILSHAIDGFNNLIGSDIYGCDSHNEIFNTGYFIIGYHAAEKWLTENVGIFQAINDIKEYEQDNFGEVTTDLSSSEKVVNMYVYIQGEEILRESKTLQKKWDDRLTDKDIKSIIKELKSL